MIWIISRPAPSVEKGDESLDAAMTRNMSAVDSMNRHMRMSSPANSSEPATAKKIR